MGEVIPNTRFVKKTGAQRARWERKFARRVVTNATRTKTPRGNAAGPKEPAPRRR